MRRRPGDSYQKDIRIGIFEVTKRKHKSHSITTLFFQRTNIALSETTMMPVQKSSTMFAIILLLAAILPSSFGFPNGAPNCNVGNAAIGQGSYHDEPNGLLLNMGIAVCMAGSNINANETIHVDQNSTYTLTLQRSMNSGIEGIFVRLAPMNSSETLEAFETDTVLTTTNTLLQPSKFCSASTTGLTHTNQNRKLSIEITVDTTGLPIDSYYVLGITSVDHHDHSHTNYTMHVMDGKSSNHTTHRAVAATNGTCQPVEVNATQPDAAASSTSDVNAILFPTKYYYTAMMLTMVGLISTIQ